MSTPKLVNFHNFLDSRSLRKNMSTPKLVNFHHFLDSRSLRKNMSTPKLVNCPHFLDSRSWEKTCIYINMYICAYVYYMILLYLEGSGSKFQSVSNKTSQFFPFFGFQELRKNMSTPKLVNFHHFSLPARWGLLDFIRALARRLLLLLLD